MAELPRLPPDWIPTARVVVQVTRQMAASRAAVWELIADHETWPEWFTALDRVEVTGDAAGVGGRRDVTLNRLVVSEEFTAWEPPERFAFAVTSGPRLLAGMAESLELADRGADGCTVTYTQGIEPTRGLGWLVGRMTKRLEDELGKGLDGLADRAERG
jgi:uncharacterized protein YndB with AHSA1/START domain